MKTTFIKLILKRIKSKSPILWNIITVIATALFGLFYAPDAMLELPAFVLQYQEIIKVVLLAIIGFSQLPVSDKSKNIKDFKNGDRT